MGSYLIVGIHSDDSILESEGKFPILDMLERGLSTLSCKWVDEIILDAPLIVQVNFLARHNVHLYCSATPKNKMVFRKLKLGRIGRALSFHFRPSSR